MAVIAPHKKDSQKRYVRQLQEPSCKTCWAFPIQHLTFRKYFGGI